MVKHPHIHKCSLCGNRYAVLNSTFHLSSSYRMKFCKDCTILIETAIRKMKIALQPWRQQE